MNKQFLTALLVLSISACASNPRNDNEDNKRQDSLFDEDTYATQQRKCQPVVSRGGSTTLGPEQAQVTVTGGYTSAVTDCDVQDAQAAAARSIEARQYDQAAREAQLQRQLMQEPMSLPQETGALPGGAR